MAIMRNKTIFVASLGDRKGGGGGRGRLPPVLEDWLSRRPIGGTTSHFYVRTEECVTLGVTTGCNLCNEYRTEYHHYCTAIWASKYHEKVTQDAYIINERRHSLNHILDEST
jgi:hypothetical protein